MTAAQPINAYKMWHRQEKVKQISAVILRFVQPCPELTSILAGIDPQDEFWQGCGKEAGCRRPSPETIAEVIAFLRSAEASNGN